MGDPFMPNSQNNLPCAFMMEYFGHLVSGKHFDAFLTVIPNMSFTQKLDVEKGAPSDETRVLKLWQSKTGLIQAFPKQFRKF